MTLLVNGFSSSQRRRIIERVEKFSSFAGVTVDIKMIGGGPTKVYGLNNETKGLYRIKGFPLTAQMPSIRIELASGDTSTDAEEILDILEQILSKDRSLRAMPRVHERSFLSV